jgi:hypothetical protein
MKIKFTLLSLSLLGFLTFNSCTESEPVTTVIPPCTEISGFTVVQDGGAIKFDWVSSANPLEYQILYGLSSEEFPVDDPPFGFDVENETTATRTIEDVGIQVGTATKFYIRGFCFGSVGEWFGPVLMTPKPFCNKPFNLQTYTGSGAYSWESKEDANSYEVEYGKQGFAQGSGTMVTTSSTSFSNMIMFKDSTYDLYVRAECDQTLGFSSWAGPASLKADNFFNICPTPVNVEVEVTKKLNQTIAKTTWETYGYRTFHVVFVPKGADPDAYQFSRISTDSGFPSFPIAESAPYDFYVKNECTNSSQSEWAGPIAVNY